MTADSTPTDVLLLTVTDTETRAVQDVLRERYHREYRFVQKKQIYRHLGAIGGAHVMLARSEMGSISLGSSHMTTHQGIEELQPRAIIMLGIAFGMRPDRQQLGDILIGQKLMLYEPGRHGDDFRARGDRVTISQHMLTRTRAAAEIWNGAPTHFGLILTGEKLVDHPDMLAHLRRIEPEAIGGEMEGSGLYTAAQTEKVDWLLVKAVSDWGDGTKDTQSMQQQAARNAAAFVFHLLEQGWFASPTPPAPTPPPRPTFRTMPTLREILTQSLTVDDTRTICYDLGIDPDDISGSTKAARVRELLLYLQHRRREADLREWLARNRPDIDIGGDV